MDGGENLQALLQRRGEQLAAPSPTGLKNLLRKIATHWFYVRERAILARGFLRRNVLGTTGRSTAGTAALWTIGATPDYGALSGVGLSCLSRRYTIGTSGAALRGENFNFP